MSKTNYYRKLRVQKQRRHLEAGNHYKWLDRYLKGIFEAIEKDLNAQGVKNTLNWRYNAGIVGAHGDKVSSYREQWETAGIPYFHGAAVYLLTYCKPYSDYVRDGSMVKEGWVTPSKWVEDNYCQFVPYLTKVPLKINHGG